MLNTHRHTDGGCVCVGKDMEENNVKRDSNEDCRAVNIVGIHFIGTLDLPRTGYSMRGKKKDQG
jgi:hypothetical protein